MTALAPKWPPKGQVISFYCKGLDLYTVRADGNGGIEKDPVIEPNSKKCGQQDPALTRETIIIDGDVTDISDRKAIEHDTSNQA